MRYKHHITLRVTYLLSNVPVSGPQHSQPSTTSTADKSQNERGGILFFILLSREGGCHQAQGVHPNLPLRVFQVSPASPNLYISLSSCFCLHLHICLSPLYLLMLLFICMTLIVTICHYVHSRHQYQVHKMPRTQDGSFLGGKGE